MRILITGGAGFVGSRLAHLFKRGNPSDTVVALDNLRRRGSELNLPLFRTAGIEFVHGDIRNPTDLDDLDGNFDLLVEASAEPSVLAGVNGTPNYVLETNLTGTLNCLEFARARVGHLFFLSTSRVYSIRPLRELKLRESESRLELESAQQLVGASSRGVAESFPTHLPRSFYGASKLASELVIQEYADSYGLSAVINRCGVIAGPGQMGKVDQGVFTLWVARHYFGLPLAYTGFGGTGKQVRDLLSPDDLYALLRKQLERIGELRGEVFNVGGGREVSTSLREWTEICREVTGREAQVVSKPDTNAVDIPLYLSDTSKVSALFSWRPTQSVRNIAQAIASWIRDNEKDLSRLFCG